MFQKNLGPPRTLATPGVVLFVILVNDFQQCTSNVKTISDLDVVGVLNTSLYSV